jgi:diguanylate cyclase (GGDEF)-like protein
MRDGSRTMLGIVALLTFGLGPALAAMLVFPGKGAVIAAAGSAVLAAGFIAWTQRLVADHHHLRARDEALKQEIASLQDKLSAHVREIRDVRSCDEVTGALNRTSFLRRLDEAILRDARLGKSLSFLLVDVEGFRAINAERGRLGGDDVLKSVAAAIQGATRGTDFVGRMGGDEFGVVLNECEDSRPAVNRLFVALQALNAHSGGAPVHVSVGAVTIETPANGVELAELFRLAEGALSSVRGTGASLCARRTLRTEPSSQIASA